MDKSSECISMSLYYRPPYDWNLMINFLKARAILHIENVTIDGIYRRSIKIEENDREYLGWIEVKPQPDMCKVVINISNSLEKVRNTMVQLIRKAFDLDLEPTQLPEIIDRSVRLPGCFDSFEVACRAIIGQQVTVKAATTLCGRVAENIGTKAITPWVEIDRYFPTPKEIDSYENIQNLLGMNGIIRTRSEAIRSLARLVCNNSLDFSNEADKYELRKTLKTIKGIGPWSAEYIIMRGSSWPDAFLISDLVIKNKLLPHLCDEDGINLSEKSKNHSKYIINKEYEIAAKKWVETYRPWSSYISIAIWNDRIHWIDLWN